MDEPQDPRNLPPASLAQHWILREILAIVGGPPELQNRSEEEDQPDPETEAGDR